MTTLLLSARATEDNQALWRAAVRKGWAVERVRGRTIPDGIADDDIVLYIEGLLAPTIAKELSLRLVEPAIDWLVTLPFAYRKRDIRLSTLGEARGLQRPAFVKPPNEKLFMPTVFASGEDLPDYDDAMPVLIAEPVEFEVEYRMFVLDRAIRAMSPYLRQGQLAAVDGFEAPEEEFRAATEFGRMVVGDGSIELPRAVALDVGRITGRGWAVVEANSAWGSGIYGCEADEVLEVIRRAVEKTKSN